MQAEEDGLTLVLSPAQLAAVLQTGNLENHERLVNRLWGGAQLLGSALQLVAGGALVLAPEPTMLTKVGGSRMVSILGKLPCARFGPEKTQKTLPRWRVRASPTGLELATRPRTGPVLVSMLPCR